MQAASHIKNAGRSHASKEELRVERSDVCCAKACKRITIFQVHAQAYGPGSRLPAASRSFAQTSVVRVRGLELAPQGLYNQELEIWLAIPETLPQDEFDDML